MLLSYTGMHLVCEFSLEQLEIGRNLQIYRDYLAQTAPLAWLEILVICLNDPWIDSHANWSFYSSQTNFLIAQTVLQIRRDNRDN